MMLELIPDTLYRFQDTCNVYVVCYGSDAALVDFGSGAVLDELSAQGLRVTDVLLTHHHRDQAQGLARAVEIGARIWVPHTEQDLFHSVDAHWQAREVFNNYNTREDRFSLLEPVPVAGTLRDYATYTFGDHTFTVIPTPGHTTGSVTLLAELGGQRVAFTGDLIAAPGKVWSLAATQWTYNGAEGVAASVASLLDVKERHPDVICPTHGDPMPNPQPAIDLLVERLWRLLRARDQNPRLFLLREQPYVQLTPHLLWNRTSVANSYALLSDSGKALLIDFGYDFVTGLPAGSDRASRRPWLYTLPALKQQFGVTAIDVVIPTHYHDDHVAGCNLLRDVEGASVWAAETFAGILERPADYDLPCLWYDPIPVDRRLPLVRPILWEEHTLTLYPLPGHTRYAVAVAVEVDGKRALATGDQFQGDAGLEWNYVYQNRFAIDDYRATATLYRRLAPDLLLSGHWTPQWTTPDYFAQVEARGELLAQLHRDLLPLDDVDFGDSGFLARITPYQATVEGGFAATFTVEVRNPLPQAASVIVRPAVPQGWRVAEPEITLAVAAHETGTAAFHITPPANSAVRRARIAVDITVNDRPFGQQAEALVTVQGVGSRE